MDPSPGGKVRLFVGVRVPPDLLAAVEDSAEPLRAARPEARWIPPANQHVTLKFLGATPVDRVTAIAELCALAARSRVSFSMSLTGFGAFPSERRARVVWVGLDDPSGGLGGLAADLDAALEPLGYPTEQRAYTPHLTLGRFKAPQPLPPELPPLPPRARRSFDVDEIVLFRSHLHPRGARYEDLRSFPLESGT